MDGKLSFRSDDNHCDPHQENTPIVISTDGRLLDPITDNVVAGKEEHDVG
jgi:hypothetical protein